MEKAGSRIRTDDLLITNQLLYQLSYAGEGKATRLTTLKRKGQKAIVTFATCNLLDALVRLFADAGVR